MYPDAMEETDGSGGRLRDKTKQLLREAFKASFDLFKIVIPVSILTRVLQQAGVVDWLGGLLGPVMRCVGLPGEMGLVWATAMVTNIYAGMVVFVSLAPGLGLTAAQASVLGAMMLVAHSLPVELRIAQKAGPRFRVMVVLRVAGALLLGLILHGIYSWGGFLQTPCRILWDPGPQDPGWAAWALGQARTLLAIFVIILGLLLLMRLLKRLGVTGLLTRLLEPVLTALGVSRAAAPVTIIGMTLGLSYGGGLIIQESRSGRLSKRDVFFSLALMGLCHSLIEDTLLMMAIGSHHSAVLWGRLVFALAAVFLLVRLLRRVPDRAFGRYFFRTAGAKPEGEPQTRWTRKRWMWISACVATPVIAFALLFFGNAWLSDWESPDYGTTGAAAHEERVADVRIVAFNIAKCSAYLGGGRFRSVEDVEQRLDKIADVINAEKPHLIFLSEINFECGPCPVNQVAYLAKKTGMHAFAFGENYNWGLPFYRIRSGNALLSRFPLRPVRTMDLPGVHFTPYPVNQRRLLWCDVQINGQWIPAGSVRNDSFFGENNLRQTELILDHLRGRPAILAGDFNARPEDASMLKIKSTGWFSGEFNGSPTYPAGNPTICIDFVLAPAAWKLTEHRVPEAQVSDHRAVVSVFEVGP